MTLADQIANLRRGAAGQPNQSGPGPSGTGSSPQKPREKRKWISPWRYLKEIKDELVKVSWPKRKAVYRGTIQVVVFSAVLAVILGGLDLAFQEGLDRLLKRELEGIQVEETPTTPTGTPIEGLPGDGTEPLQLPEGIPPPPGFEGAVETIPATPEATPESTPTP